MCISILHFHGISDTYQKTYSSVIGNETFFSKIKLVVRSGGINYNDLLITDEIIEVSEDFGNTLELSNLDVVIYRYSLKKAGFI